MSIQDLGSVGELIAAIATLGTLVYLALQIKLNTKSMKSTVQQAITESMTEPFQEAAMGDIPIIYMKAARNPEELTEEETAKFGFFLSSYLKRLEYAHAQFLAGFLEESTWKAIDAGARNQFHSIGVNRYWAVRMNTYSEEFQRYIESIIPAESSLGAELQSTIDSMRRRDGE